MISLEGPDLSGKTTLYNELHKASSYRWNIQDRSSLSMLVYARLYSRDDFFLVENLKNELLNLNNIIIILLPDWKVILDRFNSRGDEIQNFVSLKKVYDLFLEAVDELKNYPNVIVVNSEVDEHIVNSLVKNISKYENTSFHSMSKKFFQAASCDDSLEQIGTSLTHYDFGNFSDINRAYLDFEEEKDYYKEIKENVLAKIENELNGINEYSRKESISSRRFVYTQDTCLSLFHFIVRKNILCCDFFIRSSNTKNTLVYDLNFLKCLSQDVLEFLKIEDIKAVRINVKINSAHIHYKIES